MVWVGAEPEPVVFGQIIYILYISNLSCCNMSLFQTCILLKKQLSQKLLSDVTEKALCVCVCTDTVQTGGVRESSCRTFWLFSSSRLHLWLSFWMILFVFLFVFFLPILKPVCSRLASLLMSRFDLAPVSLNVMVITSCVQNGNVVGSHELQPHLWQLLSADAALVWKNDNQLK